MFLVFFFSLSFYLLHLFYFCNPSLLCFLTKNEKDCEKYNLDLENYKYYLPSRFVGLLQLTEHLVAGNLRLRSVKHQKISQSHNASYKPSALIG